MEQRLAPKGAEYVRQQIAAANNGELAFIAVLKGDVLTDVRLLKEQDLETEAQAPEAMVVIRNHPSGDLTPSGSDITAASRLVRAGIGYVLVDNAVRNLYVLTEPRPVKSAAGVSRREIEQILGTSGALAAFMPNYESRPQQLAMAVNVGEALSFGEYILAEAGTGLGKSLAYLVPAALWALRNNQRVVVSTNTINLQEQLLYKDIPLLQQALAKPFAAALVKGRANYLCRRRLRELTQRGEDLVEDEDLPKLQALLAWENTTREGTKSELNFVPGGLWELVCSEADSCLRQNCKFFQDCFFHRARREAYGAQVLITNHSLLFADIALRRRGIEPGVLPEYRCLILDEAHNIERTATDWLGGRVARGAFSRLLGRLYSPRGSSAKGLLVVLENKLAAILPGADPKKNLLESIRQELVPRSLRLGEQASGFFAAAVGAFTAAGNKETKIRLVPATTKLSGWQGVVRQGETLCQAMRDLSSLLGAVRDQIEGLGPSMFELLLSEAVEIEGVRARLADLEADLQEILLGQTSTMVRWLELRASPRGPEAAFCYAPLTIHTVLKETLWDAMPAVVLTSATLTVNKSFGYIRDRLGLAESLPIRELQYESPFAFPKQALLGVVTDLPEPTEPGYSDTVNGIIGKSLAASRGRGLVLFTSFSALRTAAAAIAPELAACGIALFSQGDLPRHKLLERFRADTNSVLMATASFWEGVDVPGESLSNLILTRLPFSVPDEPVFQARMEELRQQGKNPFYSLQVPQAVLKFKQGFGRLIRNKQDKGVVLILDKRLATRSYGRWFLESLPACPVRTGPAQAILAWQRDFLS